MLMGTRKVTISLDAKDLEWIEQLAARSHGGNVSAAFVEGVRVLRRRDGLSKFLRMSGAAPLSPEQAAEVLAEIRGPMSHARKRGKRRLA
jgi:hypothetical protein